MPLLKVIIDDKVMWQGYVEDNITLIQDEVLQPDYKAMEVSMFESNASIQDTYIHTIQDKMITIQAKVNATKEMFAKGGGVIFPPFDPFDSVDHLIPQPSNAEVADALEAAADLFITKGWCKGALKFTPEQYLEAKAIDEEDLDLVFNKTTGVQIP